MCDPQETNYQAVNWHATFCVYSFCDDSLVAHFMEFTGHYTLSFMNIYFFWTILTWNFTIWIFESSNAKWWLESNLCCDARKVKLKVNKNSTFWGMDNSTIFPYHTFLWATMPEKLALGLHSTPHTTWQINYL